MCAPRGGITDGPFCLESRSWRTPIGGFTLHRLAHSAIACTSPRWALGVLPPSLPITSFGISISASPLLRGRGPTISRIEQSAANWVTHQPHWRDVYGRDFYRGGQVIDQIEEPNDGGPGTAGKPAKAWLQSDRAFTDAQTHRSLMNSGLTFGWCVLDQKHR
jgi:hypothetical protein